MKIKIFTILLIIMSAVFNLAFAVDFTETGPPDEACVMSSYNAVIPQMKIDFVYERSCIYALSESQTNIFKNSYRRNVIQDRTVIYNSRKTYYRTSRQIT